MNRAEPGRHCYLLGCSASDKTNGTYSRTLQEHCKNTFVIIFIVLVWFFLSSSEFQSEKEAEQKYDGREQQ